MPPVPSYESTRTIANTYNRLGSLWDEMAHTSPFLINSYRLLDRCLSELVKTASPTRVLDMGCGSGAHSFYLGHHAKEVIGVDLSETQIGIAANRSAALDHVRFQVGNACRLPYRDESFDCVISYGDVISHIIDRYEEAIAEMARVARPNAIVTFEADTKWNLGLLYHPLELLDALRAKGVGHTTREWEGMRFKTFTYKELKAILAKHHLDILSCKGHNIFASLIPDRFLLEKGSRSLLGRLALGLGRLDLRLSNVYPFNRFGFNFVITARKRGHP